jgi:hypothetical protein
MKTKSVSPIKLVVRCVAQSVDESQWQAFSLEFGLAAQADSFVEARSKLDGMIQDYLYDALVGEDREHAAELLSRKAPWWVFARYYYADLLAGIGAVIHRSKRTRRLKTFGEPWGVDFEKLSSHRAAIC